jgi:hypothetical protein
MTLKANVEQLDETEIQEQETMLSRNIITWRHYYVFEKPGM